MIAILPGDQAQLINNLSSLEDKPPNMHLSLVAMNAIYRQNYLFMSFSSSEVSIS